MESTRNVFGKNNIRSNDGCIANVGTCMERNSEVWCVIAILTINKGATRLHTTLKNFNSATLSGIAAFFSPNLQPFSSSQFARSSTIFHLPHKQGSGHAYPNLTYPNRECRPSNRPHDYFVGEHKATHLRNMRLWSTTIFPYGSNCVTYFVCKL